MLKSLFRYKSKVNNGILFSCVKSISNNSEMQENEQNKDYLKKDTSTNQTYQDRREHEEMNQNPLRREWTRVNKQPRTSQGLNFTLLSYNILSQQLLEFHSYLYRDHQHFDLRWDRRFYNLVGEVFRLQPDICLLQEVQQTHLHDIRGRLRAMNYDVVYKKRTGDKPDGCAIFFKNNLFSLIEQYEVEFEQPGITLLDRENVAIVCKFQLKSNPSCQFVAATTHLLYNPKRQDIRLAQIQILLAEVDRISKIDETSNWPILLGGDFNLQPYSAPYNLIVNGILNYENLSKSSLNIGNGRSSSPNGRKLLPIKLGITDECQHANQEIKLYHSEKNPSIVTSDIELTKETVNRFQTGILRHNFEFNSVYSDAAKFASTFHHKWILVDYIFYSSGAKSQDQNQCELKLIEFLSLPSPDDCEEIRLRIPNTFLGSDHLSLAARFHISCPPQSSASTKL